MLRFVGELAGPVLWAGLIHDASGCACAARVRTWTLEVFGRDPAIIQRTLFNAPLQGGDRVLFALADDVLLTEGALGLALADRLRQEQVAGLGSGHFEQLNAFASVFESDAGGWVSGWLALTPFARWMRFWRSCRNETGNSGGGAPGASGRRFWVAAAQVICVLSTRG